MQLIAGDLSVPNTKPPTNLFTSAADDLLHAQDPQTSAQSRSPAYRLAYDDLDFVLRDEMRPVRLLMELGKAEIGLHEHGIEHTVVVFGSARIRDTTEVQKQCAELEQRLEKSPGDADVALQLKQAIRRKSYAHYYDKARELGALISQQSGRDNTSKIHIVTGGGPGTMEAANRGASDVGRDSIGLNIVLPEEQYPNRYITPSLCFRFHYFAMRKMHFLLRARALIVFPGGYGTLDELFETLTFPLLQ